MEIDFVNVYLIVFLSIPLGFVVGFAVHFYREGNRDEEFFKNRKKIKIEEP